MSQDCAIALHPGTWQQSNTLSQKKKKLNIYFNARAAWDLLKGIKGKAHQRKLRKESPLVKWVYKPIISMLITFQEDLPNLYYRTTVIKYLVCTNIGGT